MTPKQAWLYAAAWGSYLDDRDPGAVMYGFDERFTMRSEKHRAAVSAWIEGCIATVRSRPRDHADNEIAKLEELARAVEAAPCEGAAAKTDGKSRLDAFVRAAIAAAIFTTTDAEGVPAPEETSEADFEPETLTRLKSEAAAFHDAHRALIVEENLTRPSDGRTVDEQAGHDWWLTADGHGAGFRDGDWREPAGAMLTQASTRVGGMDLVYEDGRILG